jgi:hypothetical protein
VLTPSRLHPEQAAILLTFAILICVKCWTGRNSNDASAIRVSLAAEAFAASAESATARFVARLRVPGGESHRIIENFLSFIMTYGIFKIPWNGRNGRCVIVCKGVGIIVPQGR